MFSCDYRNFLDFCVDLASMSLPVFQGRAKWMTPHPPPSLYSKVNRKTFVFVSRRVRLQNVFVSTQRPYRHVCGPVLVIFSVFLIFNYIRLSVLVK